MLEAAILLLANIVSNLIKKLLIEELNKIEPIIFIIIVALFAIHTTYFPLAIPLLPLIYFYYRKKRKELVIASIFYILFLAVVYNSNINFMLCLSEVILLAWIY